MERKELIERLRNIGSTLYVTNNDYLNKCSETISEAIKQIINDEQSADLLKRCRKHISSDRHYARAQGCECYECEVSRSLLTEIDKQIGKG